MTSESKYRIRHTVVFKLKHRIGSEEEKQFLDAAKELKKLPGVEKFECLKQISSHNNYTYGISMEFSDAASYQAYSDHPGHVRFVEELWMKEVESFMEIDYQIEDPQ
ncbi:Dabb family protein [Pollutibacter soli]|uniref:Dabb family protein n=1 Tax=Pollutibacter soli TaxID=3034157 RepID=UPI00301389D7